MKLKNEQGAALVELALCLTLLFLIVFGICEFGRALYISNTLHNAAREGARRASVSPTPLDISVLTDYVKATIPPGVVDVNNVAVDIQPGTPMHGTSTVTVTVSWPFQSLVPLIIPQLNGLTLQGDAAMLYE